MLQCRAKIKELQQSYQKAREANHPSGAEPKSFCFYKELEAIFSSDPSTPKTPVDTSVAPGSADTGINPNDEVVDEEVELEDDLELGTSSFSEVGSQELFLTPEGCSYSHTCSSWVLDAGEGCSDVALAVKHPTPAKQLRLIRRSKKEMFQELLHSYEADKKEIRAWRHMDHQDRKENQEQVMAGHKRMIKAIEEQTELLKLLITLQTEIMLACPLLQPIQNCYPCPPQIPPTHVYKKVPDCLSNPFTTPLQTTTRTTIAGLTQLG
ncbi:uncharacterized protein [Emydura macquarii macquarii]|uniref:uncharacterized protein n=1 Tax=Emydura macquarii macquarii TaxID=1129001 RepID=UPI00352B56EA